MDDYFYLHMKTLRSLFIPAFLFSCVVINAQSQNENAISASFYIPAEKTIYYQLGEKRIPILISQYGDAKDIVCINLHDNESTSVEAARDILVKHGGLLIKINNNQQRVIRFHYRGDNYRFDPNRIFSRIGIEESLEDYGKMTEDVVDEVEKFGQRILDLITENTSCIIALHNNTNDAYSIKSYLAGSDRQYDARAVYRNPKQDPDNIALTTDSLLYQKMADSGFNTIWQDNFRATRDGSLSIWAGENERRYINIETEHGQVKEYREMLEKLLTILKMEK